MKEIQALETNRFDQIGACVTAIPLMGLRWLWEKVQTTHPLINSLQPRPQDVAMETLW